MNLYLNTAKDLETQRKEKYIALGVVRECPQCNGSGYIGHSKCKRCAGEGVIAAQGYFGNR